MFIFGFVNMSNLLADNSDSLPIRWKWLGLARHPFPNPHRAEYMEPKDIDDTVVLDNEDARDIRSNHSTVVLAPYGGGKTMYRRYFEEEFRQQPDTLVVFVDLRDQHPNEDIILFLLRMVANSIWEMMLFRANDFSSCSEPTQTWFWSFLRHYHELDTADMFNEVEVPIPSSLKLSLNNYGTLRERPFKSNSNFYNRLKRTYKQIKQLGFEKIIFLVDNSDEDDEKDSAHLRRKIPSFFEDVRWYSVDNVYWKWFLPNGLSDFILSTAAYEREHLATANIEWTREEMMSLLENRLIWAAEKETTGISLHGLRHKDLEKDLETVTPLDEQLVALALEHQEAHGAPRTLLKLGNLLIKTLPKFTNPEPNKNDALIKREEWEDFKERANQYFEKQKNASSNNLNAIRHDEDVPELSIPPSVDSPQEFTTKRKSTLCKQIADSFNEEEVKELCHDLEVVYEDLPAEGRNAKIRELVKFMDRRGRLGELIKACHSKRPHIAW